MTALEYMEKQVDKHCADYVREVKRGAPQKDVDNILAKIRYYAEAAAALKHTTEEKVNKIKEILTEKEGIADSQEFGLSYSQAINYLEEIKSVIK